MTDHCSLCAARASKCHPWEIYWGKESIPAQILRSDPEYPDIAKPIYHYEDEARAKGWAGWAGKGNKSKGRHRVDHAMGMCKKCNKYTSLTADKKDIDQLRLKCIECRETVIRRDV